MRVGTDDVLYDVNNVWLGPPGMTFPARARYAAYLVGSAVFVAIFVVFKSWFGLGLFTAGWALAFTIAVTRWVMKKINLDRPVTAVMVMFFRELASPRAAKPAIHGQTAIRLRHAQPMPRAAARRSQSVTDPSATHPTQEAPRG